jgi:hypothetical protein
MPPADRQGRRFTIGLLLIVVLLALAVLIFFLTTIVRDAKLIYHIVGVFPEAPRLRTGSEVWLAGYRVGEVSRIESLPLQHDSTALFAASLSLPEWAREKVREDSRIELGRPHLLGEPVVEITPGTPSSPSLPPGETLFARPPISRERLRVQVITLRTAIDTLVAEGAALRPRLERPAREFEALSRELAQLGNQTRALSRELEASPLRAFLADTSWRAALRRIEGAAHEIGRLAAMRAAPADSLEREAVQRLALRAEELEREIDRLRTALGEPQGFIGRWERDPALREAVARVQAHLDSLIAVTKRKPWRYFF